MESWVKLFNEWEIQLLVLLSFTLQIFLFFTGCLRRCTTNKFLRLLIWFSYLGADLVAVYALGFLARHEADTAGRDTLMGTHQLAFFWAPFLLIHLGGQDTITAFAMEDNNLWLRHLLNLVVQVTLALYIFGKSTGGPNMQLVVPSILLFVTGTIKYGERTWALWCGSLQSLAISTVPDYVEQLAMYVERLAETVGSVAGYSDVIIIALNSIRGVRDVFAESLFYHRSLDHRGIGPGEYPDLLPKILEIELCLIYDDIYTKAMVLRTMGSIVLRCVSRGSYLVAFVLFSVSNKQRYNHTDIAITYALFIGGFFLEVCAIFITMISPWTWARLKAWKCDFLASINIGLQRKRWLWSNSMGQYNFFSYLGQHEQQSSLCKQRVMAVIKRVVNKVCGEKQKLWISKMVDTNFVEVDEEIMRCVIQWVVQYSSNRSSMPKQSLSIKKKKKSMAKQFPNVGPLLQNIISEGLRLQEVIFYLHIYTEVQINSYSPTGVQSATALVRMCRKMSNYMFYLLIMHPEMLPVKKGAESGLLLDSVEYWFASKEWRSDDIRHRGIEILRKVHLPEPPPDCSEAQMLEIREAWIQLLVYAAGKSRAEMHAAQLAGGGELLTFVWLLMAHHLLGDVHSKIEITDIFNLEEAWIPTGAVPYH